MATHTNPNASHCPSSLSQSGVTSYFTIHQWPAVSPAYDRLITVAFVCVVMCAIAENVQSTQYGRFGNDSGLTVALDPRVGWWLMELPCSLLFYYLYFGQTGPLSSLAASRFLGFVFVCHYLYRGWAFPLLLNVQPGTKNFDLSIAIGEREETGWRGDDRGL